MHVDLFWEEKLCWAATDQYLQSWVQTQDFKFKLGLYVLAHQ